MAEASVVEINNQIRKQAEKSTIFPEKMLADGQRNVEKIYSDTQSSVAEIAGKEMNSQQTKTSNLFNKQGQ